jgi:hypothetical protein
VRSVDLALYADELAAEATMLAARLERARCRLQRAALEREARRMLDGTAVERLELLGVLRCGETRAVRAEIAELTDSLRAVERLQAWVEERVAQGRDISGPYRRGESATSRPPS